MNTDRNVGKEQILRGKLNANKLITKNFFIAKFLFAQKIESEEEVLSNISVLNWILENLSVFK